MSEHLRLAQVCETSDRPDRQVELEIWRLNGGSCPPGTRPHEWLHCYMESVDAALELVPPSEMAAVMREAVGRLSARFRLHASRWPEDRPYRQHLARYVTAAALRRLDERARAESGSEFDLRWLEFDEALMGIAETASRHQVTEDVRPLARVWSMVGDELVRRGLIRAPLPVASNDMIQAALDAHIRKRDDMNSPYPTEEPGAGDGPIGYAWRAMAEVHAKESAGAEKA